MASGVLSRFWAPQYRRDVDMLERVQQRVMEMIKHLEHLSYKEILKGLGRFSLDKAQGDLSSMYKYLMEGSKEVGVRLFSMEPDDRTRDNGHELKDKELQVNMKNFFFLL